MTDISITPGKTYLTRSGEKVMCLKYVEGWGPETRNKGILIFSDALARWGTGGLGGSTEDSSDIVAELEENLDIGELL